MIEISKLTGHKLLQLLHFFKKISPEEAAAAKRVRLEEMREGREQRKRELKMDAKRKEDEKRKKETLRKALYRTRLKDENNIGVDIAVGSKNRVKNKGNAPIIDLLSLRLQGGVEGAEEGSCVGSGLGVQIDGQTANADTTSDDPIIAGLMADREMSPDTLEEFNRQTPVTTKTAASKMMEDPKVRTLLRDKKLSPDSLKERQRWINDNPLAQEEAAEGETLRRAKIFKPYPELSKAITLQLLYLREAGVAINLFSATAIMRSHIHEMAPELFSEKNFVLSSSFVLGFLKKDSQWTFRAATRAAKKVPDDWELICKEAILRISQVMRTYDVPPALVINGNQTGVTLFPSDNRTYALKGSKQGAVLGQDDKRHTTLMSLPKPANRRVAEEWGMFFKCEGGKHWLTLQTTKDWVEEIVVRYIEKVKKEKSLPDDQFAILYIDAWAVHRSEAFRDWMHEHHPTILLVFIPATCTVVLQPADVGLQRMSRNPQALFAEWLATKVGELKERAKDNGGKIPAKVFSKEVSTPNLRELVPMFMTQAFLAVKSREDLVKKNPMFAMQFAQPNLSPDEAYEDEDAQYEE
ncbi:hypothetical protein QFC20_007863 [Naganishia adeliensis]|uniref:Uncharacterized protein n=1 Tax=Naganishia adeliensis TaxID=92952 RepID=A0ACC2UUA7_9TREE|nr:hypothetical protein QFC20_007863 [Naganishia adeliensis]